MSLHDIAPEFLDETELRFGFDAFRDRSHAQRARERHHRFDHRVPVGRFP
jgi:hypothetical protein